VEAISLRDVTFLVELSVKNPYPLGLSFAGMSMEFWVEGSKVFSAAASGGFAVPARGSKANAFTVTLSYADIAKVVADYAAKDMLATKMKGVLVIPLPAIPGLPKDISFNYELDRKIPAIKPRVAIVDFAVKAPSADEIAKAALKAGKKLDAEKARSAFADMFAGKKPSVVPIDPAELDIPLSVSFTVEVTNEAKAALSFSSLDYELLVNGESLVRGVSSAVRVEGARTFVTITSVFSSKRLSSALRTIFSERKGAFVVTGKAQLKLPDAIRKEPVPLTFSESGSFKLK